MTGPDAAAGPLAGVRVIEVGGIGPLPFAGTMLSDMGADVVRVDRVDQVDQVSDAPPAAGHAFARRGRHAIALDLKQPAGRDVLLSLIDTADVLLEGFRPGVMEKLGLGPDECLRRCPRLVYGRVTGWGRSGPLAHAAGHDLNYIALAGVLHAIGTATSGPVAPLNLVGDYAGGAMFLAFGVVCALHERHRSGRGQVVDAAMLDGSVYLMGNAFSKWRAGSWTDRRASNTTDHGAFFYNVYETADGRHVSIAPIEPKFRAVFCSLVGLDEEVLGTDREQARTTLTALFRTRTRDEWVELLEGSDACFAPVLGLGEVAAHPQVVARGALVDDGEFLQPAPTPRFGRSGTRAPARGPRPGEHTRELLCGLGLGDDDVADLIGAGAVAEGRPDPC